MSWLGKYKSKLLLTGVASAGPLAGIASYCASGGALTAVGFVAGFAADVAKSWLADEARDLLKHRGDARFNHDLQKSLAQTLVRLFQGDTRLPGPLLSRLREITPNFGQCVALVALWREHIEQALDPAASLQRLEALFPPVSSEAELLSLATRAEHSELALWQAFFEQSLQPIGNLRLQVSGGIELLREHVPVLLAELFPGHFAVVLKEPAFSRAWIAYQKIALEQVAASLSGLEHDSRIQLVQIAELLAEMRRQEGALTHIAQQVERTLEATQALHSAVFDEWAPEFHRTPPAAPAVRGMQALRVSERMLQQTVGREEPLRQLGDFLDGTQPFCWWGVVGAAGMGKSHLALALVEQRRRSGWDGGFLESSSRWLDNDIHLRRWQPRQPTLIVIDYAAARAGAVIRAIVALWERRTQLAHPVRLLLLDRLGGRMPAFIEQLERLARQDLRSNDRHRIEAACHRPSAAERDEDDDSADEGVNGNDGSAVLEFLDLQPLARESWRPLLSDTLVGWGDTRALPDDADPLWNQIDYLSEHGRPLLLLVVAILLNGRPQGTAGYFVLSDGSQQRMLFDLLKREREHIWADAAGIDPQQWDLRLRSHFENGIAFITLLRGLDWAEPRERDALLRVMCVPAAEVAATRERLASMLGRAPGRDPRQLTRLRPLEPDLFGEYLLAWGGVPDPDNWGESSLRTEAIVDEAFALNPRRCCELLILAARDFPTQTAYWLAAALRAYEALPLASHELSEEGALDSSALVWLIGAHGPVCERDVTLFDRQLVPVLNRLAARSEIDRYDVMLGVIALADVSMPALRVVFRRFVFDLSPPRSPAEARLQAHAAAAACADAAHSLRLDDLEHWTGVLLQLGHGDTAGSDASLQHALLSAGLQTLKAYLATRNSAEARRWTRLLVGLIGSAADAGNTVLLDQAAAYVAEALAVEAGGRLPGETVAAWRDIAHAIAGSEGGESESTLLFLAQCCVNACRPALSRVPAERVDIDAWLELMRMVWMRNANQSVDVSRRIFKALVFGYHAMSAAFVGRNTTERWRCIIEDSESWLVDAAGRRTLLLLAMQARHSIRECRARKLAQSQARWEHILLRIAATPFATEFAVLCGPLADVHAELIAAAATDGNSDAIALWFAEMQKMAERHGDGRDGVDTAPASARLDAVTALHAGLYGEVELESWRARVLAPAFVNAMRGYSDMAESLLVGAAHTLAAFTQEQRVEPEKFERLRVVLAVLALAGPYPRATPLRQVALRVVLLAYELMQRCAEHEFSDWHVGAGLVASEEKDGYDHTRLQRLIYVAADGLLAQPVPPAWMRRRWSGLLLAATTVVLEKNWIGMGGVSCNKLAAATVRCYEIGDFTEADRFAARLIEFASFGPLSFSNECQQLLLDTATYAVQLHRERGIREGVARWSEAVDACRLLNASTRGYMHIPRARAVIALVLCFAAQCDEPALAYWREQLRGLVSETRSTLRSEMASLLLGAAINGADAGAEACAQLLRDFAASGGGAVDASVLFAAAEERRHCIGRLAVLGEIDALLPIARELLRICARPCCLGDPFVGICMVQTVRLVVRTVQAAQRGVELEQWKAIRANVELAASSQGQAVEGDADIAAIYSGELPPPLDPAKSADYESAIAPLIGVCGPDWISLSEIAWKLLAVAPDLDPGTLGCQSLVELMLRLPQRFDVCVDPAENAEYRILRARLLVQDDEESDAPRTRARHEVPGEPLAEANQSYLFGVLAPVFESVSNSLADANGWVALGSLGQPLRAVDPDFSVENYGCTKLSELFQRLPQHFETYFDDSHGSGNGNFYVRRKRAADAATAADADADASETSAPTVLPLWSATAWKSLDPGRHPVEYEQVEKLLPTLYESVVHNADAAGWANLANVGNEVRLKLPWFKPSLFGCSSLSKLIARLPQAFALRSETAVEGGPSVVYARVIRHDSEVFAPRRTYYPLNAKRFPMEAARHAKLQPWLPQLFAAVEGVRNNDGWSELLSLAASLRENSPAFDCREFGCDRLHVLFLRLPTLFELATDRTESEPAGMVYVRPWPAVTAALVAAKQTEAEAAENDSAIAVVATEHSLPHLLAAIADTENVGWAALLDVGRAILKVQPDFSPRQYGCRSLEELVRSLHQALELREVQSTSSRNNLWFVRVHASDEPLSDGAAATVSDDR